MVRVRFAPSPTGYLHLGNTRAALLNWLFAKKNNGQFILRIDDTDQTRSEKKYEDAIIQDLAWLSLGHDQFFRQSERLGRYTDVLETLKKEGLVYACYETPEELDFKRKIQLSRGAPPLYDRSSLHLTQQQIDAFEKEGRHPHWRFKLAHEDIRWHDLVRGDSHFQGQSLSDPIVCREDGVFLYTFASVIDDLDYNITHIIRGEDHVANTATQIQLFKAISPNHTPIEFAHTSLVVDRSGEGFSKRQGSLSLSTLRDEGIIPMAICSLLARLGTSQPVEPFHDINHLSAHFSLEHFGRAPSKLDVKDLWALNEKIFHQIPFASIAKNLPNWLDEQSWDILKQNIVKLSDLSPWEAILTTNQPFTTQNPDDQNFLKVALEILPSEPWTTDTWDQWMAPLKEQTGRKAKSLFMPIRQALTGMDHGPDMRSVILLLGYDRVKTRLQVIIA